MTMQEPAWRNEPEDAPEYDAEVLLRVRLRKETDRESTLEGIAEYIAEEMEGCSYYPLDKDDDEQDAQYEVVSVGFRIAE